VTISPSTIIQPNRLTLSPETSVQVAIQAMVSYHQTYVLVVEQTRLVGIFTERDVARRLAAQENLQTVRLAEAMTRSPRTVSVEASEDIFKISQYLLEHHIRHLPVVDAQDQVVGVITPQSLRRSFQPEYLLRCLRVSEVMALNVLRGQLDDRLLTLVQRMVERRVSCVVITDPLTQNPIGIITERDISRLHTETVDLAQVSAAAVMTQPLVTVQPQDSLWSVHEQMQRIHVRRLVVAHPSGELAGIVTQTQMLRMMDPVEIYQVMQQMQSTIARQSEDLQRLNQELSIANQELRSLATIDELTQVANRRYFNQFLEQVWQRDTVSRESIALLVIDVDHFKCYNDAYGHIMGDQCLARIALVLQAMIRQPQDLLARYGGEEFVIVLPETDAAGAERLAQAIIQRFAEIKIPHQGSPLVDWVTLSIGVCAMPPSPNVRAEGLMEQADRALYQAKANGRNGYALTPAIGTELE
jgi:diguanylate cyclase (GGDEF)-like protein